MEKNTQHNFFSKEHNIFENLKKDIIGLKNLGFDKDLIEEIISLLNVGMSELEEEKESVLSPLIIDSNYDIYLPDYNNLKIKMPPLSKILYILFLRHPEGIFLKQIADYEHELFVIYKQISNRENLNNMSKSIKRICTPSDKSINEKLSRIKAAFINNMTERYANHYIITGKRGKLKQILINRELVFLPDGLSFL